MDWTMRTEMLLGRDALERLASSKVAVFGIGGVGGFVCEGLIRAGVGELELIDSDKVDVTNINRQIIALNTTVGRSKAELMKERALMINPEIRVTSREVFFGPDNREDFDFASYDYVVDAIDSMTSKIELIVRAKESGTPIISAM
ncbi:MAG: ThiF family adenylyltransferase, partial [Firmicutes bacterium]|nr:ThiF family adenylyltransferase [Bacillota bacterium]